jgi:protein associated with RNAse G/E
MNEYTLNDFIEIGFMVKPYEKSGKEYRVWQGYVILVRKDYIVIEGYEGKPFLIMREDIKSSKKIKEPVKIVEK